MLTRLPRDDEGIVRHRLWRAGSPLIARTPAVTACPPLATSSDALPRGAERRTGVDRRHQRRPVLLDTRTARDRRRPGWQA